MDRPTKEATSVPSAQEVRLHVDILRGRNYPQTEDDPCACSTYARLILYDSLLKETIGSVFESPLQEGSNTPFYNTSTEYDLPPSTEMVVLVVQVVETTRRPEPYIMFYGSCRISTVKSGKNEETVVLIHTDPVTQPEEAEAEVKQVVGDGLPCPNLSFRLHVKRRRPGEVNAEDHSDAVLSSAPVLDGSYPIIPKNSQYVWFNLASDRKWSEAFTNALVSEWRKQAMVSSAEGALPDIGESYAKVQGASRKKEPSKREIYAPTSINTVADIIVTQWNCCRSHEVLSWLRLSGEAFSRGERLCSFSREDVMNFRRKRKEQIYLLQDLAISSLLLVGESELRDTIDHLWIHFAIGVDHDPSRGTALPYEARKRMKEAGFEDADKVALHSSFLNFLVPSLAQDQCDEMVTADLNAAAREPDLANIVNKFASSHAGTLQTSVSEMKFTAALLECVGAMLDTLTEVEVSRALKMFKPCVISAHQRLKSGAKEKLRNAIASYGGQRDKFTYRPGGGIKIDHLDRLGRRKKEIHFR